MFELSIKNVSKSFGNNVVLNDISLNVNKGDIFGVLGLSGAGKSTLVRCINGLETFDQGEIYFRDELLCNNKIKVSREHRRKIGMIFQQFNLLEQRTVLGNVMLGLEFQGVKDAKEIALAALKEVGLAEKSNAYPSQLSGGQQQRVAIARVLALKPDIILCDEATSALDPETTIQILDILKRLNKDYGITIVMISHQLEAIEYICNKVAIIDKAKIVEQGDLSEVFLNPKTSIAKNLVYSNQVKTMLDDDKMLRIIFDGNSDEPVIANIVTRCSILVSIVYANTKVIDGKIYGQLVLKLPKNENEIEKLEKYLTLQNIKYEEVNE